MIRLQLLPDYVFEGERITRAIIASVVISLLVVGTSVFWLLQTQNKLRNMERQAAAAAAFQGEVAALQGQIDEVVGQIQPVDDKREYMLALKDYGDVWPERMRQLSYFVYRRVEVLSATLTPEGFELEVRTKTTDDVARMLMNFKKAYDAGLLAAGSLNVEGLTGWPNATSPKGWRLATGRHIDVPLDVGSTSPVRSNTEINVTTRSGGGGGGGAAAGGAPGEAGGAGAPPGDPGAAAPPPSGAPGPEAGAPGGGGGGGGGGAISQQALQGLPKEVLQLLLPMSEAAKLEYIDGSVDPIPQPYLNLRVRGRWAQPVVEPQTAPPAAAAPGGEPGMPPGMGPEGAPPPGEAPPGEPAAGPPGGGGGGDDAGGGDE